MKSIALVGLAGTGKDTLAWHLHETYGHDMLSFALPLKRIVQDVYQFTDEQMFGPSKHRDEPDWRYPMPSGGHLTPRIALERFGTEAGRYCYVRTWLDLAMRDARASALFAFTDCRFQNEIDACRELGAAIVRLTRTGIVAGTHGTEAHAQLPDSAFDLVLSTDGTIEQTRAAFDEWYATQGAA